MNYKKKIKKLSEQIYILEMRIEELQEKENGKYYKKHYYGKIAMRAMRAIITISLLTIALGIIYKLFIVL